MSSFEAAPSQGATRLYRAVWRWHFYAGLITLPFLLALAITGLIMVYGNSIDSRLGPRHAVAEGAARAPLAEQSAAALAAVPDGALKQLISPATSGLANIFVITAGEREHLVSVDPNGAKVLSDTIKDETWFFWASNIHGSLLLGDVGDRLLEIAAGLGIILAITGVYLWWPRGRGLGSALLPNLAARGRAFWKELHVSLGLYLSLFLVLFLVSGLSWTGIWGSKLTQAWSTFPAAKWDNVPLSDKKHADMNHGSEKEVPWGLEQTPMPASGSAAGITGLPAGTPVNIDTVAAFARAVGFDGQFHLNVPAAADGVFTISSDTMEGDSTSPTGDRTMHIDQYTGKILAEVGFRDYGLAAKAMAVGVALHQADMGWWNTALNALFCLSVIFMSVSGVVMWWKRRPQGALGAPLYPSDYRIPRAILAISAVVAVLFPLTGLSIIAFSVIDYLLPKRLKESAV